MQRSPLKVKPCRCGCGKPPTISCRGWNFNCLPKTEKDEKINRHLQSKRKAQQKANTTRLIHLAQKEVGLPKNALKVAKRQKPIPKFSGKMLQNLKIYSVLRKDFLKDNPICQCGRNGCKRKATDVHHRKGRGIYLNVVEFWLAVARVCHTWINEHPKEAMELGLTISRLNNENLIS